MTDRCGADVLWDVVVVDDGLADEMMVRFFAELDPGAESGQPPTVGLFS